MARYWPDPAQHWHAAFRGLARVLVAGILGTAHLASALETDPVAVDESPAISIGNFEVSRYILDKNYNQFVAARRAISDEQPSTDEIAAWFRLFIARQALCARLVEEGYLDRPEIQRTVRQMVRQILTQADGPLYQSLIPADAMPPLRFRELHEASARVFDVVMVRFDDAETSARHLVADASPGDFEEAIKALAQNGMNSGFDVHDGPSVWPHGAFQEIAQTVAEGARGTVIGPITGRLGVYHLMVRSESKRPLPDFEATRKEWERYVRRVQQNLVQRVRRRQILQNCGFEPDPTAMTQLAARLRPVSGQPHTIDEKATLADPATNIASYSSPGGRRPITDRDFVLHFNQRMVRSMPRATGALVVAVEDLVVEQSDYAAAIAARFDQAPKFVQDRRNFELNEARTLYEQEVVVPQLTISPAELLAYYSVHGARYRVINEVNGVLYKFTSGTPATEAQQELIRGETSAATKRAARILDPVVVRRDGPPLVGGRSNALLMAMSEGQPFGPFEHEGETTIFVKRSNGTATIPSFSTIEDVIRRDLLREKLDARVVQLFEQRPARHALRVHFEFSEYGIKNPFEDHQEVAARHPFAGHSAIGRPILHGPHEHSCSRKMQNNRNKYTHARRG
jgi:hypothetical protein